MEEDECADPAEPAFRPRIRGLNIQVDGSEVTVRFGRIGTNGQVKVKTFPDAAAAQCHADKLIGEKTGKGYIEVG